MTNSSLTEKNKNTNILPPLQGQVSHHRRFSGHKHIIFGMCVIIFLENRTEAPLWPNSQRVQDVPGSTAGQEFQLEYLAVHASGRNSTCLFPVEGRKQKGIILCVKQIKSNVASRVLLCWPLLFRERSESRGCQPVRISAPLSRVHKEQSLDFRLQVLLIDLCLKPRKSKQREGGCRGGLITVDTLHSVRPSFSHP